MSFRFAPRADMDIRKSHDPMAVLAEIKIEFSALPPPDAPKLASGERDEGALYLLVLPECGYRVVYQYPRVMSGGNEFLILSIRPGSEARLDLPPAALHEEESERIYTVSEMHPQSSVRNIVVTEADEPPPSREESKSSFFIKLIQKKKDDG